MTNFLSISTIDITKTEKSFNEYDDLYDYEKLKNVLTSIVDRHIGQSIISGRSVLMKPNWVTHSTKPGDQYCLRTHDNFILATLAALLDYKPTKVLVGDAPIQGCDWGKMISPSFKRKVNALSIESGIPVQIIDFRRRTFHRNGNRPKYDLRPIEEYIIFDLGSRSFLEPIISNAKTNFRVTDYDPGRMTSAHSRGVHKYCIRKDFFDADVIISLPKIKTHQKTAITGALKNIVGINGDKDFLPHHRLGGTKRGGDCYPGGSYLRYLSELSLDNANKRQGTPYYWLWKKLSTILWRFSLPGPEHNLAAGWYGNDTTWRMVKDLNVIAEYGLPDGTFSEIPQRKIYSICDGIIAGQGDGPLEPSPLKLGVISCTDNSLVNDRAIAILMGLNVDKIPLLSNPGNIFRQCNIMLNGIPVQLENLKGIAVKARPPRGWAKALKEVV